MNGGKAGQKYGTAVTGLACAMGIVLLSVGAMVAEGQSVEQSASPAPERILTQTVPPSEKSTTSSWTKPEFEANPKNMGSPYVPLDSWIYPAFDRLIALGYVRSAIAGQRPWTRLECSRLLNEANGLLSEGAEGDEEALAIHDALAQEFSHERALLDGQTNRNVQVESIYTRVTGIAGRPLTDGYHITSVKLS